MGMMRCDYGHTYDDQHTSCPYCGVPIDIEDTVPRPAPPGGGGGTVPTPPPLDPDDRKTVAYPFGASLNNPVVGWLVCIAGPDRGRDYRLHAEKNFIGRSDKMDVVIANDRAVSQQRHAVVSHNPKRDTFRIEPGSGRGIVEHNGEEVSVPQALAAYDRIELGKTTLMFIPFCGEQFSWVRTDGQEAATEGLPTGQP